ncbi:MAG: phosphoenolpyruvate-utilizing N-terminal domain-containing protein [Candidatus Aminicenantales bacterium]
MDMTRLRGIGVSPGIAMGEVLLAKRVVFTSRKEIIADDQVPDEIKRLHQALDRTRADLTRVKESVREKMGPDSSLIFEAHLLILEDPTLVGGLEAVIRDV